MMIVWFLWDLIGFNGILLFFLGILRDHMGLDRILWDYIIQYVGDYMELNEMFWDYMGFIGEYCGIIWNC